MFTSVKRHHLWLAAILGMLMILLGLFLLIVPHMLSEGSLKQKTIAVAQAKLGGQLEYQNVTIRLWPRPGLVVNAGRWKISEAIVASVDTITVYPRLFPLLIGNLKLARVEMTAPVIDLPLTSLKAPAITADGSTAATADRQLYAALDALLEAAPKVALQVYQGRLNLSTAEVAGLTLQDIDISINPTPKTIQMAMVSSSEAWQQAKVDLTLHTRERKIAARMQVHQLVPGAIIQRIWKDAPWSTAGTIKGLDVQLEAQPDRQLYAQIDGDITLLTLSGDKRQTTIKDIKLESAFRQTGDRVSATIKSLTVGQPQAHLSGALEWNRATPHIALTFQGIDLDVPPIRKAALHLGGQSETVRDIFHYVRGGRVPKIELRMAGETWADVDQLESLTIVGNLAAGNVFAPDVSLVAENVYGDVVVKNGVLHGDNLKAQYGQTQGDRGTLRVALREGLAPFYFDMHLAADASQLPPILKRLVENETFRREMDNITLLEGQAHGQVTIDERRSRDATQVVVDAFDVRARYGRIPSQTAVRGGRFVYTDEQISVADLSGSIGTSQFSGVNGKLQWRQQPVLQLSSGNLDVDLAVIYPWLLARHLNQGNLQHVTSMTGRLAIVVKQFTGPPLNPAEWDYQLVGAIENVVLARAVFPPQVTLSQGAFEIVPAVVHLTNTQAAFADTVVTADGRFSGYNAAMQAAELNLDGQIGAQTLDRLTEYTRWPLLAHIRTPLLLKQATIVWKNNKFSTFTGQMPFDEEINVEVQIRRDEEIIDIQRLTISDASSQADIAMRVGNDALTWQFQGNLVGDTLQHILRSEQLRFGHIRGEFEGQITPSHPLPFKARGRIDCHKVDFNLLLGIPLTLDQLVVEAQPAAIDIQTAVLHWQDMGLEAKGQIVSTVKDVAVDLDVIGESVDYDKLAGTKAEQDVPQAKSASWVTRLLDLPLRGKIDLQLQQLAFAGRTWRPFKAKIDLGDAAIKADIYDAQLCGILTPGRLELHPQEIALTSMLSAQNQALHVTAECLKYLKGQVDGTFDFNGTVTGRAPKDELIQKLKGDIDLKAREGRIYKSLLFSQIFAVLNITEIFWGQFPDFQQEGFSYQTLEGRAVIDNGQLNIENLHINGNAMELAIEGRINLTDQAVQLNVLVSPLKTFNRMVRTIPVVKDILAGNFIAIPLKVTGDLNDPKVNVMPVSAVGSGLLGVLERTLKAPVKLIEPAFRKPTRPPDPPPDDDRGD